MDDEPPGPYFSQYFSILLYTMAIFHHFTSFFFFIFMGYVKTTVYISCLSLVFDSSIHV